MSNQRATRRGHYEERIAALEDLVRNYSLAPDDVKGDYNKLRQHHDECMEVKDKRIDFLEDRSSRLERTNKELRELCNNLQEGNKHLAKIRERLEYLEGLKTFIADRYKKYITMEYAEATYKHKLREERLEGLQKRGLVNKCPETLPHSPASPPTNLNPSGPNLEGVQQSDVGKTLGKTLEQIDKNRLVEDFIGFNWEVIKENQLTNGTVRNILRSFLEYATYRWDTDK